MDREFFLKNFRGHRSEGKTRNGPEYQRDWVWVMSKDIQVSLKKTKNSVGGGKEKGGGDEMRTQRTRRASEREKTLVKREERRRFPNNLARPEGRPNTSGTGGIAREEGGKYEDRKAPRDGQLEDGRSCANTRQGTTQKAKTTQILGGGE